MSIFEYDEEKELELYRRAERAVGEESGISRKVISRVWDFMKKVGLCLAFFLKE